MQSTSYSVVEHTLAASLLVKYFSERGVPVSAVSEGSLTLDAMAASDVVFLGVPHTSNYVRRYAEASAFVLSTRSDQIANRQPRDGEKAEYVRLQLSKTRVVRPMLLRVIPGAGHDTRILILGGHSSALGSYLTTPAGLDAVSQRLKTEGWPASFESVVMVELEGDRLIRADLAAFREIELSN